MKLKILASVCINGEVSPPIWDVVVEELTDKIADFEEQDLIDNIENWRKYTNRRKFDRELFEKYGFMKDLILDSRFQMVKHYLEEHANFNFFVGDPLLPVSTAVIILFMLHKRVKNDVIALAGCFVFSINPLYVCILAFMYWLLFTQKSKPKDYKHLKSELHKGTFRINQSEPVTFDDKQQLVASNSSEYDHVLLGNDLGTLYTAALLAKNGHQCCVLQLKNGIPYEIHPDGAPCAAPIHHIAIGKIERYQALLDVAQSNVSSSSTSTEQRVIFAPIGQEKDGYTSSLIRIHHTPHSLLSTSKQGILQQTQQAMNRNTSFIHLRVGEQALAHDLCNSINLDKTTLVAFFLKIRVAMLNLTTYLLSRIVPNTIFENSPISKSDVFKQFVDMAKASSDQVIYNSGLDNTDVFTALSSIAAVGAGEALPGVDCSGYALAHALNNSTEGTFYPVGGAKAIANSLIKTIHRAGGIVYKDIDLKEIDLEELDAKKIKAVGVKIRCLNSSSSSVDKEVYIKASKSVISGLGVIATHTKLLPAEAITSHTQEQLSELRETRPKIRVVYWLEGTQEALQLRSTDYYEVDAQSINQHDALAGSKEVELYSDSFVHIWSPSAKDPRWTTLSQAHQKFQLLIVEFEATALKRTTFQFSTAKDTSDFDRNHSKTGGPEVYYSDSASDEHTKPNHEQYSNVFNTLLSSTSFSKSKKDKLQQRADNLLKSLYPLVIPAIRFVHVEPPVISGGSALACTSSKFKCKLSAKTDVENLYITGRDLATNGLAGDLQGGWIAANSVLDYQLNDLLTSRNIIADLNNIK